MVHTARLLVWNKTASHTEATLVFLLERDS